MTALGDTLLTESCPGGPVAIVASLVLAGRRFTGPTEMLEDFNEVGCWEERIA